MKHTYKAAGVDQHKKDGVIDDFLSRMKSTFDASVVDVPWGFAGLYSLKDTNRQMRDPLLVSCADGVGTKIKLAVQANKHDTVGVDLVAMNVNDMICVGAKPLFFLDYIATSRVKPPVLKAIMKGIIDGCTQAGCALLGGETAEMPDTYTEGEYDLAGFAVGVAERDQIFSARDVRVDDVLIGLPSSGVHSNGFSLVRKIIGERPPSRLVKDLLTPTRIYTKIFEGLRALRPAIRGAAHITGGGMGENIPRVIPPNCDAVVKVGSWPILPVFETLQKMGSVDPDEMFRVFNMGIGLVFIVDPEARGAILRELKKMGESAHEIGIISRGKNRVRFVYT